jgi:hypothetical protein
LPPLVASATPAPAAGPRTSRLLAACVVLAPLFALVGALIGYQGTGDDLGEEVRWIEEHTGRWLASNALWLYGSLLFIPGAIGLLRLVRRPSVAATVGASLLVVGSFFHGAVISYSQVEAPLAESGIGRAEVVRFVSDEMFDHTAFLLVLAPFVAFYLGLLVLGVALWRSRVVAAWVPATIVVALAAGIAWRHEYKNEVMFLLLAVALGYPAAKLWNSPARDGATEVRP